MKFLNPDRLPACVSRLASRVRSHSSLVTLHSSSGFTLIEILVASLLLGMLMTILTMVFNSSAIAWRTGRASNAQMGKTRREISYVQYLADNALRRVDTATKSKTGRVLGAWQADGTLRGRAVEVLNGFRWLPEGWDSQDSVDSEKASWVKVDIDKPQKDDKHVYLVGVHSWGPDGKENTLDDIDTMPVTVE